MNDGLAGDTPEHSLPAELPADNEIEVSVFGAGYGEAIVVHVGSGRWIAIDSVGYGSTSVTREYLETLGVNLASQVDLIIATHWHDDHIRGIADLFDACPQSEFVFPQAMLDDEFIRFAAAFQGQSSKTFSSGVEEFGKVLETADRRTMPKTKWPLRLAANGYVAYRKAAGKLSHGQVVSLEALSPSHFDMAAFLARVSGVAPQPRVLQRAPTYGRNDVCSAFFLQVGGDAVLFGADVEANAKANSGWNAVLSSSTLPEIKAQLVKIPHHGGLSGHHAGMWDELAIPKPIGTLTPWAKGRGRLPSATDIQRIKALVGSAFSTGPSAFGKEANQPTVVAKVLTKDRIKLRRVADSLGHVRHRASVTGSKLVWRTDLFGRACPLEAMAA
jgi:hypothetical protein